MPNEVDEFVRRVRAMQQAQQSAHRGGPTVPPHATQPVAPPPRAPVVPARRADVIDAEIIEAETVAEGVAQHVQRAVSGHVAEHLDNREFTTRADLLGDRVEIADDVMDAHLQQVFDHQLGSLRAEETPPSSAAVKPTGAMMSAADIGQTLRQPTEFRRALILNEILQRPTHRWRTNG